MATLDTYVEEITISPWIPITDREVLACIGKLTEESGELTSRLARVIIQGTDAIDPKSGRTNLEELEREIADVRASMEQVEKRLRLDRLVGREAAKSRGYDEWHRLIKEFEEANK